MSWFHSLRSRLTALFLGVAGGTVLIAAIGTATLVDEAVWAPLDTELGEEAETICSLLGAVAIDDLRRAVAAIAGEKSPGPGKFIEVSGDDGAVLTRAGRVPPSLRQSVLDSGLGAHTLRVPGHQAYRVVSYSNKSACRVVVGAGARSQIRTIRHTRLAIGTGATGLLVVLGVLAWVITNRAAAELGRLAEEIERIEAGSLAHRLASRRTLEVDRLATVLNRLLERLEAAMTHLGRFTAQAAHELRTPIAGLRARLEVTLAGRRAEETYRDGLLDALEQTERLENLAEHLLALSAVEARVGARDVVPVRLDAVAREVSESLEAVAQEQGRRFACIAPTPVTIPGEPQLLKRLLLNLVDNAFRHTPAAAGVQLRVTADGASAVVEVCDDGPGISDEDLPRVFERFQRGTGGGAGSGLGLAFCREIVAQHRGTIAVDNRRGTTITVRLPL